jgi:Glyoxalase/Bleomycin resistance protein/Dioxygenase superfamily
VKDKAWRRASKFHQIGIVVDDLEAAMQELAMIVGIPAQAWELRDQTDSGFSYIEPGAAGERRVHARYARAQSGATTYQLIAVDRTASVWTRALSARRPVFAVGHLVDSVSQSLAQMEADGAKRLAWGRVREGTAEFDYAFVELPRSALVVELMAPAHAAPVPGTQ